MMKSSQIVQLKLGSPFGHGVIPAKAGISVCPRHVG